MNNSLLLSQALLSKFCHDIAGKVGAVSNGIEILNAPDESIKKHALSLADSSSKELFNMLVFFRFAYGIVSTNKKNDITYIEKITKNLFNYRNTITEWHIKSTKIDDFGPLLCNLVIVADAMILNNGTITLNISNNNFEITAKSGVGKINSQEISLLTKQEINNSLSVNNVQYHLIQELLKICNYTLDINQSEDCVTLHAKRIG